MGNVAVDLEDESSSHVREDSSEENDGDVTMSSNNLLIPSPSPSSDTNAEDEQNDGDSLSSLSSSGIPEEQRFAVVICKNLCL
ncbi:predicted protein [Uncinocarpus reesii 1704]|uniref:Uncharacterized protein n=1 Tax=Uncinocarpus reesii (strain UAMH 1704) TaxID=336963 RepID=C4JKT9_UNCRE|nr:uncharacterized protein UREG_00154 [Uncinocarpus reesii 1704]EEP75308.1 predicted protein [Uncinocarpus reesii 1704]